MDNKTKIVGAPGGVNHIEATKDFWPQWDGLVGFANELPTLGVGKAGLTQAEVDRAIADHQAKKSPEMVKHPAHYNKHPSGIECIDVVQYMGFNLGNAVKYIWRADLKADAIEDMKKAIQYLQFEIDKRCKNSPLKN